MIDAFYGLMDSSSPDWFVFSLDFLFLCFSLGNQTKPKENKGNQRRTIESNQPQIKEKQRKSTETEEKQRKPKETKANQRIRCEECMFQ
jgi:hypothetical protein